ncbi:MAG: hypothetical protein CMJ83_00575 [Planctomycetes bacterium]|nr:hypothetical protein [Planctomycetota bacterium]
MVRTQEPSDAERLDRIMAETTERHALKLVVTGWARKTYDVFRVDPESRLTVLLLRVESFATQSGEVQVFEESAMTAAQDIAIELEKAFGLEDAIIVRKDP